jgi:DNA adenine methylase
LLERVDAAAPFGAYHEPFVGGGALFFELHRTRRLRGPATLSDANPNLIDVYRAVRDDVDALITALREHARRNSREWFYEVRAEVPTEPTLRAARIIYLNKTCFNGLYRENSRGIFNVPWGDYANPTVCDEENLRATSAALQGVEIGVEPFDAVATRARPGDLVYFDPPYDPVSRTSSFTKYAKGGFGEAEQRRLAALFGTLKEQGVKVLLSNSWTPLIRELYAPFGLRTVQAARSVNSKPDGRGKVAEALVTSWDPPRPDPP